MLLNLWVVTHLGVEYQLSYLSDAYIMIHNSRKLQLWSSKEIILLLEVPQHEELY